LLSTISLWHKYPAYYQKSYLLAGMARAIPRSSTREGFAAGQILPVFAYRYYHDLNWFSTFGGNYLYLIEKQKPLIVDDQPITRDTSFALARVYLENSYMLRVYHPVYLSGGFRLFYLYPLAPPLLPNSKHREHNREFGLSIVGAVHYFIGESYSLHITAERWRGVNSAKFHGAEYALALGKRL
jgi:hypothetical protein